MVYLASTELCRILRFGFKYVTGASHTSLALVGAALLYQTVRRNHRLRDNDYRKFALVAG